MRSFSSSQTAKMKSCVFAIILMLGSVMGAARQCSCPAVYQPVCGSDGLTYGNHCSMTKCNKRKGVSRAHWGKCNKETREPQKGECETRKCLMKYVPVCGDDGVTYANRCMMESCHNGGVKMAYGGKCRRNQPKKHFLRFTGVGRKRTTKQSL